MPRQRVLAGAPRPSLDDWLALYDLAEEKGEHVRLDWKVERNTEQHA